jgi:hypothetical protein
MKVWYMRVVCLSTVILSACTVYGASINATITTGYFVPEKPVNLAVSITDSGVQLSWSPPSSNGGATITDYVIEYRLSSGGVWSVFSDGVSVSASTSVTGLTNDTAYDFRVAAVNVVGQGQFSDSVSATPGAPAQVIVTSIVDADIPSVAHSVRITNEGVSAYEYQYTWCITDSDVNLCGGSDDVFSSMAAKLIQPGENWDTILYSTVSTGGNYWFHVQVDFGSDTSYANQSFTATSESGGGGGGSSSAGSSARSCVGADINKDKKVTLVDFSIMLLSFNKSAPFKNICVDINRDGKVSVVDFSILLTQWGKKPVAYPKAS